MKYITFIQSGLGPAFVAFSGDISHADMAKALGVAAAEVRSAGFICQTATGLYCHGHSQSLGVGSLVSDSQFATSCFK